MAFRKSFAPYSGSWRRAYDKAKAQKVEAKGKTLAEVFAKEAEARGENESKSIFGTLCFHCQKPPMNCDCMPCDCAYCHAAKEQHA